MKNKVLALVVLLAGICVSQAVTNVLIGIQGTNVVISWPGKTNASYLIQYRAAFDTNNLWVNLTNEYPAAVGTNRTSFTIYGVVCPPSTNSGGGGSTNPPPGFNGSQSASAAQGEVVDNQWFYPLDEQTVLFLARRRIVPPYIWDVQFREPHVWELEARPPMPWEAGAFGSTTQQSGVQTTSIAQTTQETSSLESVGCTVGIGFYRIFQLPKWPNGISNSVVEGLTFSAVDFDDYFFQIASFHLFVDGQSTELGVLKTRAISSVTNNGVDFWFNEMANGPRQLRLTAEIRLDDDIGIDTHTPTLTLTSTITSLLVSNPILYTNFENTIVGNSTIFEAFSIQSNVDWTIDVYDVVNDFVISHSGYSPSGQISWTWNLYDWTGMLRDDWGYDPWFYSEITISAHGAFAAAATTKPTPLKVLDYPQIGQWLIVYQDREKRPTPRQQYIDAMVNLSGGPALYDVSRDAGNVDVAVRHE